MCSVLNYVYIFNLYCCNSKNLKRFLIIFLLYYLSSFMMPETCNYYTVQVLKILVILLVFSETQVENREIPKYEAEASCSHSTSSALYFKRCYFKFAIY